MWFYGSLAAMVFIALAASLPVAQDRLPAHAETPEPSPAQLVDLDRSTGTALDGGAAITPAVQMQKPGAQLQPPLREAPVGNPDRRKVVMVPVNQAGRLLTFESDIALP